MHALARAQLAQAADRGPDWQRAGADDELVPRQPPARSSDWTELVIRSPAANAIASISALGRLMSPVRTIRSPGSEPAAPCDGVAADVSASARRPPVLRQQDQRRRLAGLRGEHGVEQVKRILVPAQTQDAGRIDQASDGDHSGHPGENFSDPKWRRTGRGGWPSTSCWLRGAGAACGITSSERAILHANRKGK